MKRFVKALSLLMVILILITSAACAQVKATASVKIRKGPGLNYEMIDAVVKGTEMSYKGSTKYDNRGVAWYKVGYKGKTGWVSSVYSELYDHGYYDDYLDTSYGGGYLGNTSFNAGWYGEYDNRDYWFDLSDVLFADLEWAAEYIGLAYYEYVPESEAPNQYGNKWITIDGHDKVEYIQYCGGPYRFFGIDSTEESDIAGAVMMANGLEIYEYRDDYILFERPAPRGGYDSSLILYLEDDYVSYAVWNAYT